ncbi:MAG: hypothetical protein IKF09_05670 [Clostridiales bacterium]|nr:hypothetical protein [Clostridiales bacterium]
MNNDKTYFDHITMTGRLVYIFMCIEEYLVNLYPDKDWTPVALKMWQWTNKMWDEGFDIYLIVVPENILEFDSYEETKSRAFDGNLDKTDYDAMVSLFSGITDGDSDDEINRVLYAPVDFNGYCEGTGVSWAMPYVDETIKELEEILISRNIPLPDKTKLDHFRYDDARKPGPLEKDPRWGEFEETESFSIILKNNNDE